MCTVKICDFGLSRSMPPQIAQQIDISQFHDSLTDNSTLSSQFFGSEIQGKIEKHSDLNKQSLIELKRKISPIIKFQSE